MYFAPNGDFCHFSNRYFCGISVGVFAVTCKIAYIRLLHSLDYLGKRVIVNVAVPPTIQKICFHRMQLFASCKYR